MSHKQNHCCYHCNRTSHRNAEQRNHFQVVCDEFIEDEEYSELYLILKNLSYSQNKNVIKVYVVPVAEKVICILTKKVDFLKRCLKEQKDMHMKFVKSRMELYYEDLDKATKTHDFSDVAIPKLESWTVGFKNDNDAIFETREHFLKLRNKFMSLVNTYKTK